MLNLGMLKDDNLAVSGVSIPRPILAFSGCVVVAIVVGGGGGGLDDAGRLKTKETIDGEGTHRRKRD